MGRAMLHDVVVGNHAWASRSWPDRPAVKKEAPSRSRRKASRASIGPGPRRLFTRPQAEDWPIAVMRRARSEFAEQVVNLVDRWLLRTAVSPSGSRRGIPRNIAPPRPASVQFNGPCGNRAVLLQAAHLIVVRSLNWPFLLTPSVQPLVAEGRLVEAISLGC
jgi:hypothetical protein